MGAELKIIRDQIYSYDKKVLYSPTEASDTAIMTAYDTIPATKCKHSITAQDKPVQREKYIISKSECEQNKILI